MSDYVSTVRVPGTSQVVTVSARIGTQTVLPTSGPIDCTDFGSVALGVTDDTGRGATIGFTDPVFVAAVRDALGRGLKVADTRDYSLDKPRNDAA